MCHLTGQVGNGAEKNQRRDAEGAEERRGEEPFLSSFSASLCESLRLCVKTVLTSAAAVPRCDSCAFSRLVPLRVLRRVHFKATQSHPKATPRPYTRHRLRSTKPPQGHPKATPRPPQGYPKATPRLPQGYPEALDPDESQEIWPQNRPGAYPRLP